MAKGSNMVNIDVKAFEKWFDSLKISRTQMERDMGNTNFVQNTIRRGTMTTQSYKLLCALYQLPDGSFIKAEEVEVEEEKPIKEVSAEDIVVVLLSINSKLATLIEALK